MKMKLLVAASFVVLLLFIPGAPILRPGATLIAQVPPELPRGISAGRPGIFRFIPREQLLADRAELLQMRASVDRLYAVVGEVQDPARRRQLQADLELWQVHMDRAQQRLTASASPTAEQVEMQLDDLKGQRMCGVCHTGGVIAQSGFVMPDSH